MLRHACHCPDRELRSAACMAREHLSRSAALAVGNQDSLQRGLQHMPDGKVHGLRTPGSETVTRFALQGLRPIHSFV
jgi:hypothetical protein